MPDPYTSEIYGAPPSGGMRVPNLRRRQIRPDDEAWVSNKDIESDVEGFQRELVQGDGQVQNKALVPRGAKVAAFNRGMDGTTYLPNDRAGRVTITGNEAMTPQQRGRVVDMARDEQGYRAPLRGSINGQSFEMPASGPRVNQAKASQFLALDAQERAAAEAKAERDRQFQAQQIERQSAADRQARMDDMASLDRRENRVAIRDERQRRGTREDYAFNRQQQQDTRADASRLTPQQERERATYQAILDNPNASPRAMALATQGIARIGGAPPEITAELARPGARDNAAPVMDVIQNDPMITGRISEIQKVVTRAQDLPWYKDLANAASLGLYEGEAATPEVEAIKAEIDQIAQAAAEQYSLDINAVRQAILNQILPGLTDQTPGVSRQIRTALR